MMATQAKDEYRTATSVSFGGPEGAAYMMAKTAALGIVLVVAAFGCQQIVPVTVVPPDREAEMLASSDIVVEGHASQVMVEADYTFLEEFGPATMHPERGWATTFSMDTGLIIKGQFSMPALKMTVRNAEPGAAKSEMRGMIEGLGNGTLVRLGWKEGVFGERQHVQMVVLWQLGPGGTRPATTRGK
jgi:hypothetical protein